jgi:threonine/homoserine/homoserine lactone efflux protein
VVRKVGFWLIVVGQALVFWSLFVWLLQRPAVQRAYLGAERVWNGGFGLALGLVAVRALMGALWD